MSLVIVAGAGPGVGDELLRRFSDGGYHAVGFARTPTKGRPFEIHQVDLPARRQVATAVAALIETALDHFENCWHAMVLSAFNLAQVVMQPMVVNGGGAFIDSGATARLRGSARFAVVASAKFALRGLTPSLAREYQPLGVSSAPEINASLQVNIEQRYGAMASPLSEPSAGPTIAPSSAIVGKSDPATSL